MGYVTQDPATKRYSLGPRLIYLGGAAQKGIALTELASEPLRALRDRFNETVHLGVLNRREVIHIAVFASTHPVKMAAAVGERAWCHTTALGKSLLAWADDSVVDALVIDPGLPRCTAKSIASAHRLRAELALVRRRGYAIDDEESAEGLRCVSAPIRDANGDVIAAVSLSGPAERLSAESADAAAPRIIEAAGEISARLGWEPAR